MHLSRSPDSTLVPRARDGDADAREELFRRHWTAAWRRAYAVTGSRVMADDVAQDALVRAFDRLGDLDDPAFFGAWLGRIVARRAIDVLRREARLVSLDAVGEPAVEWADGIGEGADLRAAVARLDPDRRAAVVMRYWLDMTPPEIAEALDLPVGTINSRLGRGLADLRGALAEAPRG
ncbi:MAG: RNA polymerase sigma factor [Thermoleophilia bacterium]